MRIRRVFTIYPDIYQSKYRIYNTGVFGSGRGGECVIHNIDFQKAAGHPRP